MVSMPWGQPHSAFHTTSAVVFECYSFTQRQTQTQSSSASGWMFTRCRCNGMALSLRWILVWKTPPCVVRPGLASTRWTEALRHVAQHGIPQSQHQKRFCDGSHPKRTYAISSACIQDTFQSIRFSKKWSSAHWSCNDMSYQISSQMVYDHFFVFCVKCTVNPMHSPEIEKHMVNQCINLLLFCQFRELNIQRESLGLCPPRPE
mmetsp:Transcript_9257/g.34240  ORF Transcript_9257/g.34240 Transcript_9257/m.34240 type:complete len:204 (-) Transcript_9257:485-1096(-)